MHPSLESKRQDIAIIGMAGRFPDVNSIDEMWSALVNKKDCITRNMELNIKDYINAYGKIKYGYFDADFFGISDAEAEMMDPQQRMLFTLVYEALENSNCLIDDNNPIGLFAGADEFQYVWKRIYGAGHGTEMDFYINRFFLGGSFTSKASYHFNFTGPSLTTRGACATSLMNVHLACQSLLNLECYIAVAGGISIYPEQNGYYVAEGTLSRDGYTRSFSNDASGFVPGNGGALVVLKRLEDSIRDKDRIYAVIRGSAINNDGYHKIGFSAPSVHGEMRAIEDAMKKANIVPSDIGYVETHGTGTVIGDAVELEALNQAFNNNVTDNSTLWPIGSAKTNFGHLSITAGITGLIKATLMLHNKKLVPSLYFSEPNDKFDENIPFYVNTDYKDWIRKDGKPLMAGVSSFGIGGTNVHVVVEEYPRTQLKSNNKDFYLLPYSGKRALDVSKYEFGLSKLLKSKGVCLDDIEFTLHKHRQHYGYRNAILVYTSDCTFDTSHVSRRPINCFDNPEVVFLFPGTAMISSDKIISLCENDIFKASISDCFNIIEGEMGVDIWAELKAGKPHELLVMPITFSINYAISKVWESFGVIPDCVVGYSLGEINAACLSGVLSLYNGLRMVIKRSKLFSTLPSGDVVTVSCSPDKIKEILIDGVEVSAVNAENRIMISGTDQDITRMCSILSSHKITYVKTGVGRPGHCAAVDDILAEYEEYLNNIVFSENNIPIISTCTGKIIDQNEWCQSSYWVKQTRNPVLFKQAMDNSTNKENTVFLEIGIGDQLTKFVRRIVSQTENAIAINSLSANDGVNAYKELNASIALAWCHGVKLNYSTYLSRDARKGTIPSYPFNEKLYLWKSNTQEENKGDHGNFKSSIIVNGLDKDRIELTKYLAGNRDRIMLVEQNEKLTYEKIDTSYLHSFIHNVETKYTSQSQTRCLGEIDSLITAYDQLCASASADFFRHVFSNKENIKGISKSEISKNLNTIDSYLLFQDRLLECLIESEFVIKDGNLYKAAIDFDKISDLNQAIESMSQKNHEFLPFMNFFAYCASHYTKVFQGQMQGKEVLYPGGDYKLLKSVYEQIPETSKIGIYASIVAESVYQLVRKIGRRVRILEFGAGTGLLSWTIIEKIKDMEVEYYFTDIGRSFLTKGKAEADRMNYDFVHFERFDITKSPDKQGIDLASYDIIISCNVIQAMEKMDKALDNVSKLIRKNGYLFLLQTVEGHKIQELIFGLTPEWWNYSKDSRRQNSPVLTYKEWKELLNEKGYENVGIFPDEDGSIKSDVALIVGEYSPTEEYFIQNKYSTQFDEIKTINPKTILEFVPDGNSTKDHLRFLETQYPDWEIISTNDSTDIFDDKKESICRNEVDEKLISILFDTIGIRPKSLEQPIFELGVDSLSGLIISTKIRTEFDISFSIKKIMAIESIKELSDAISMGRLNNSKEQGERVELHRETPQKGLGDLIEELMDLGDVNKE